MIVDIFAFECFHIHIKLYELYLDVDYFLSDKMVIETIERAKSLSASNVSAADLIHLTKCLIEYEADVKGNVEYMVSGLTERAVFEFTKKKISGKCMKTSP